MTDECGHVIRRPHCPDCRGVEPLAPTAEEVARAHAALLFLRDSLRAIRTAVSLEERDYWHMACDALDNDTYAQAISEAQASQKDGA